MLRLFGIIMLLSGLFTIWAVRQPWYARSRMAQAWFRILGPRLDRVLKTVLGVGLTILGALLLWV
jgi:hypothetical protein